MKFLKFTDNKLKVSLSGYLFVLLLLFSSHSFCIKTKNLNNKNLSKNEAKGKNKNKLDYFSGDANAFQGRTNFDFGVYGKFYSVNRAGVASAPDEGADLIYNSEFAKNVRAKKEKENDNNLYMIKITEDVNEMIFNEMYNVYLGIINEQKNRIPKQLPLYVGVRTYEKNNKKCVAGVLIINKGVPLSEITQDTQNFIKNKNQIFNIIYSLLKAVSELHTDYDRTHYDIKPQSFLVANPESNCQKSYLIHIESSLRLEDECSSHLRIYTEFYTSPRFNKTLRVRQRFTDNYSLGVTILELLAGLVGVKMDYSQGLFSKIKEEFITKVTSNKENIPKYLQTDEFEFLITVAKNLLNHQNIVDQINLIERKFMNYVCVVR